jgi:hypothetical protein
MADIDQQAGPVLRDHYYLGYITYRGEELPGRGCFVSGRQDTLDAGDPCSDGEGQFGEDRREPVLRVGVHAEFVVAAAEVLDEGVSGS